MRDFVEFINYIEKQTARKKFSQMAYYEEFCRIINYKNNNQCGHFKQLFYAIFDFYQKYPDLKNQVTPPPFDISLNDHEDFIKKWREFLNNQSNSNTDYDVAKLKSHLPYSCGGELENGGGWSPTAKILFSVIAQYK